MVIDQKLLRKKLQLYYTEIFKPTELIDIVGKNNLDCLEIACAGFPFLLYDEAGEPIIDPKTKKQKKKANTSRKNSFPSVDMIGKWLSDFTYYGNLQGPACVVYYGAKFMQPCDENMSMEDLIWRETDFKIDIDIDGATKIRYNQCHCVGKTICNNCLRLAMEAASHAIISLHEDFGLDIKKVQPYWSGREGIHIHYPYEKNFDSRGREYIDQQLRRNLISYLQYVVEEVDPKLVKKKEEASPSDFIFKMLKPISNTLYPIKSDSMRKRIQNSIALYFFQQTSLDKMLEAEWFSDYNKKLVDEVEIKKLLNKLQADVNKSIIGSFKDEKTNKVIFPNNPFYEGDGDDIKASFYNNFKKKYGLDYYHTLENIIKYRYPRYDVKVSLDTRRLFKMPLTIDARTDKCYVIQKIPVKNILNFEFSLDQLKTLDDMIKEYSQ